MGSPAVLFRNELSQRLCTDTHFSLPNANVLVGILIDAMEYNLSPRCCPLESTTIQNVLKVSKEIECLSRMLQLNIQVRHRSIEGLHPLTTRALYMLALPETSLLSPCPEVITLMTYVAVAHRLSAYIGPYAVYGLVSDFNGTSPRKFDTGIVKRTPGVGPRVARRRETGGELESMKLKPGSPPHLACWTIPTRLPTELYADSHSVPFQLTEVYAHAIRDMPSCAMLGRGEFPAAASPRPLSCVLQPRMTLVSFYLTPTTHRHHYGCPRNILAPSPALAHSSTSVSRYTLATSTRTSSLHPYHVSEEPDTIEWDAGTAIPPSVSPSLPGHIVF